jgi:hypothetical protein
VSLFRRNPKRATGHSGQLTSVPANVQDARARVLSVLEQSRQNVKYIVKAEREGEKITPEIVNLRLK